MSGLPILVEAGAVRVLIAGAGAVAARKARALCEAGADVRVVAPEVSDAMRPLVDAGHVTLTLRAYESGDLRDVDLVIAATNFRDVNARIAADARAAHRLVNVADRPDEGSFATMATHRSGALVVGVSAGGVPGAAARIRDAIAARFDTRYASALADLADLRRALLGRGDATRWRTLSREALDDRFCDAVERAQLEERVSPWR